MESEDNGLAAGDASVTGADQVIIGETVADTGSAGMPQLDFSTFPNQIFWLLVTLILIYLVLSRIALPRIGAVLAERQGTISNDVAAAEELRDKAKAAEAAYEKSLADARAEASRIVGATKAEVQAQLDAELKLADAEIAAQTAESEKAIAAMRASAVETVTQVARETAREIVAAFGGKADPQAVDAAVDSRVKG